jgi:hypothetical protein
VNSPLQALAFSLLLGYFDIAAGWTPGLQFDEYQMDALSSLLLHTADYLQG